MLKTLKKLIVFFPAREKRTGGAIIAAMFVAALLEMAGIGALIAAAGFFLRRGADARQIVAVLAAVVVILAGKNLFSCWIVRVQAKFVYHRQTQWSEALFARYLGGDYREITGRGGTRCALLLSRISLICEKVLLPAMQCAADFFVAVVLGIALGVYMFWPVLAGIAFFLPAGVLIYAVFRKKNRELGAEESTERLAAGKLATESLDGVEIIRPMRREAFFAARYRKMQEIIGALDVRLYTWGQMPRLALESAAMIYLLALFCVMLLWDVPRATILLDFAALAAVMSRLLPACSRIHYNLTQIRQHQEIAEVFCRDMAHFAEPDFAAGADLPGFDGSIELRDITFRYGKDAAVLENFHLAVRPKECVGITGRTGCGKSTVFALILGFVSPEKGWVLAGGVDLKGQRNGFLRQIGFVPQKNFLFEDTVRGNLTLGESISDEKLHAALKMAHLDDFMRRFPGGLDGHIGPNGNNLSGGQKQRLAIARALCRDGVKLLLLDEPTSSLDAMTESEFAETLGSLRGKITILVISHREATLRGCDRVISLDS